MTQALTASSWTQRTLNRSLLAEMPWRPIGRYRRQLERIRHVPPQLIVEPSTQWRAMLQRAGAGSDMWFEACALVDHVCRRALGKVPYDTQWLAALAMLDGRLAEMATGEGKTLALGLAAAVAALSGRRVHVLTANPYLVERDALLLAPLYLALGLRVRSVAEGHDLDGRRQAYRADIVYATAKTVVFDALRDEVVARGETGELMMGARVLVEGEAAVPVLPALDMVLIDEADSILVDEASMPLIVSAPQKDPATRVRTWTAWKHAIALVAGRDYTLDEGRRQIHLKSPRLPALERVWISQAHRDEWIETALRARHFHLKGRDYVVRDGLVCIVDPITGRVAEGRQWGRGLHGMVALKEKLVPPPELVTVAQTTYSCFFPRYRDMAGMSGTLRELRAELRSIYSLDLVAIPLRRPSRRLNMGFRVFDDESSLHASLVDRIRRLTKANRAVLVGTDTVGCSERVSRALSDAGVAHRVLNADQGAEEASIVGSAGAPGAVTVATHMAGRGTDIAVAPEVLAQGGLHVLSLQLNVTGRLDRQLIGRCARQGDPGSHEHWVSLELMKLEKMPLTKMTTRVFEAFGERLAASVMPASLRLFQRQRAQKARRHRARLHASARYWDQSLATAYRANEK